TVESIAADYIDQIRKIRPAGPYHLVGWSFGGLIAQAMASLLQRQGDSVGLLALLDTYPPIIQPSAMPITRDHVLSVISEYIEIDAEDDSLDPSSLIELSRCTGDYPLDAIIENVQNSISVMNTFIPQSYAGDLLLFTAADSAVNPVWSPEAWRPY